MMTVTGQWREPPINRHYRRQAWALVPRRIRDQAPVCRVDWLPDRTRAALSVVITRRNELDRALAEARGLAPDDPKCARFQGPEFHEKLDRVVRQRRSGGLTRPPTGAMAVACAEGVGS